MTDPDVASRTFEAVLGRAPSDHELARLFAWYVLPAPARGRDIGGLSRPRWRRRDPQPADGSRCRARHRERRAGRERPHQTRAGPSEPVLPGRCLRHRLTRSARDHARCDRSRLHDARSGHRAERGDRRRRHPARRRRRGSAVGAISLAVASGSYSVDELRRSGADFVLASLEEPFPLSTDAWPTVRPSTPGCSPSCPSSMLRGCTTRSGIWQRSSTTSGLPRPTRRIWSSCCPSGFRRVPISTGSDYYLSLQGFAPQQTAYAHTHPDSEECGHGTRWLRRGALRHRGAAVAESRDGDRAGRASPARGSCPGPNRCSCFDGSSRASPRARPLGRARNDHGSRPVRKDRGAVLADVHVAAGTARPVRPERSASENCSFTF